MSTTLTQASNEWMSRPADQRFLSLPDMLDHARRVKTNSSAKVLPNRVLQAAPIEGSARGLAVVGPNGHPVIPSHWAFGQLAQRANAPAGYLRDLPAPLAADCINYGLQRRDVEELGVLLTRGDDGPARLAAVTGPNYGRIWNETIIAALMRRFGDGVTGDFRVPGEFGKALREVTKENTTLYASDRDMFVFLADEQHRIEVPNRRNGETGTMARGFFVWNSEVGAQTLGIATFLFDYVCMNRIVWGADQYREIRIRHTSGAPWRWIEDVAPALENYAHSSTASITAAIADARAKKFDDAEQVEKFLTKRFTRAQAKAIAATQLAEEDRPIETLWDCVTATTAYAKGLQYQDARVSVEREAGKILDLAA